MRKLLLAGLVAGSLIAGAGTALGDSRSGSSESVESDPYNCPTATNPGTGPGADDPGDCQGGATTYTVTEHTNNVDCTDEGTADTEQGIVVSVNGEPSDTGWGEAEVCNDGDAPVQGRTLVGGSFAHGIYATADGDRDNDENARGWATVSATADGPATRCGDDAGNLDSTETTAEDGPEDCPAPPAP